MIENTLFYNLFDYVDKRVKYEKVTMKKDVNGQTSGCIEIDV